MFWQENTEQKNFLVSAKVQDAVFSISAKILPIDHSYLLFTALLSHLKWLPEVNAGIFDISVADGNGWEQNHKGGFYYPSKRSRLSIRLPKNKLEDAKLLVGKTLNLGAYQVQIVKNLAPKLLIDMPVLFAKHICCEPKSDENEFLQTAYQQLQALGITPKKMMAGLNRSIKTKHGTIYTRSLMVADLSKSESITLQQSGIGEHRLLGCGLFVPQKGIENIDSST